MNTYTATSLPPQYGEAASGPPALDDYVVGEEIGRGAHGVVYRGHRHGRPDEIVAIKIIENHGSLDRLLVEPDILKRLDHPNIVHLYDSLLIRDRLVLIMEFLEGADLKTRLDADGPLPTEEVQRMLSQVADALAHAHERDVIHCDLKPSNIQVMGEGEQRRYVLTDFGVSRMAGGIQTRPRVAGTYLYMAPEQIRGRTMAQSDLWGLGAVAVTALTGKPPFHGDSLPELIRSISYDSPPFLEDVAGPELTPVIERLLEKPLENRTGSAAELRDALKSLGARKGRSFFLFQHTPTATEVRETDRWEVRTRRSLRQSWIGFWIGALLFALPGGIVGSALELGGALLIYQWCQRRAAPKTKRTFMDSLLWILGLAALGLGFLADMFWSVFLQAISGSGSATDSSTNSAVNMGTILLSLPGGFMAAAYFGKAKLLQRHLSLRRALQSVEQNEDGLLQTLLTLVNTHPGETNLHLRYVEALLHLNRSAEAIVEAQLVLEDDPYNFDATLHLAQGYFDVGLPEQCEQVCNGYLAVSGISFEFEEMLKRARTARGIVAADASSNPAATLGAEVTR